MSAVLQEAKSVTRSGRHYRLERRLWRWPRHRWRRTERLGALLAFSILVAFLLPAAPASAQPALGVQFSAEAFAESPAEMSSFKHAGVAIFRVEAKGTENPNPNWAYLDKVFGNAAENGIRVLPILNFFTSRKYPTAGEYAKWDEWVGKVVSRYGVGGTFWNGRAQVLPATAWEVWNEPNRAENSPVGATPTSYGQFLGQTAPVIRAHGGPGTKVLFGGLDSSVGGVSSYIQEATAAAGGPSAYDGLSLHPFAWKPTVNEKIAGVEAAVKEAREGLDAASATGKPIWITEIGWPLGAGAPNQNVTEPQQEELLTRSFNYLKTRADIESIIWYNSRDTGGSSWADFCGLREFGGYVRPAWWAFLRQTGAPPWSPTGWYNDQLSGELTSNPDIASWGSGRLDMVTRGTDMRLWHRFYQPETGWSVWERVPGAYPNLASGPSIVSWGGGRLDVVAASASDQSIEHWWWGGGWFYDNLGGTAYSGTDPDISSGQSGRLDVYIKGTDSALWHKWWYGTGWSGWERIGGSIASGPGAVSWGPGRYDVVARAPNNTLEHWWWTAGAWYHDNLGGELASGPDMASPEPGRLDVFSARSNSALGIWSKTFRNGSGWGDWEHIGAPITGGPGAVAWGPNRIDVVASKGPTGGVAHYWWQP